MASSDVKTVTDPVVSAEVAGLNYVSDRDPGIARIGRAGAFRYRSANGKVIRNAEVLNRIRSLVIPPAWKDVWISNDPNGHLQAVGRDARGRKQYRYHPRWRETRDSTKYHRLVRFGEKLPAIRVRVTRDLRLEALQREKVLATIVRFLETTSIRVGNEEYTRQNNSFGLTTLRDRHVKVQGAQIRFFFRGKSGVQQEISLQNKRLAKIVRKLQDLPGYELFQYVDENNEVRSIGSVDVNSYIREISGEDFTAKDFRTWNGTVLAAEALSKMEPVASTRKRKKNVLRAIETVAEHLGNTISVGRKCYIHPAIVEAYLEQTLEHELKPVRVSGLTPHEAAVLRFLRKRLKAVR